MTTVVTDDPWKKQKHWLIQNFDQGSTGLYPYLWRDPNSLITQCKVACVLENQLNHFRCFDTMPVHMDAEIA